MALGCGPELCAGPALGGPGEVTPSRGGHGQSHFPPGKDPAGGLSQNAEGRAGGGLCPGAAPAGGNAGRDHFGTVGCGADSPDLALCPGRLLGLAGPGPQGPEHGEQTGLHSPHHGDRRGRQKGREPHRGAGYPAPGRGRGHPRCGGDGGGEFLGWGLSAPVLSAPRRGSAGPVL